jgi:hypothetical protein
MKRSGVRHLGAALGVLGLAAATFLVPAQNTPSAAAAWSEPKPLEAADWLPFTSDSSLGTTRGQDSVAVWTAHDPAYEVSRVRVRRILPNGDLGALVTVSPSPASAGGMTVVHPVAAVDADGDVVVAWTAQDPAANGGWQVFTRRLSSTGSLSPVRRVGVVGQQGGNPTVAVADGGRAVITWDGGDSQMAVRLDLSGQLGGRFQVGQRPTSRAAQVKVTPAGDFLLPGMDSDGRAELTMLRWDGTRTKIAVDPAHYSNAVDADADAQGRRSVVFTRDISTGDGLFARRWTTNGLTAPKRVSPSTHNVRYATIDTDREGDSTVSWIRQTGWSSFQLYLRQWQANGTLGPVQDLGQLDSYSAAGMHLPEFPAVAVDADGDAVVTGVDVHDTAWRRTVTRSGTVSAASPVGTGAARSSATITPAGRARVIYHETGTGQIHLRAN